MCENNSSKTKPCQAFIFPTGALATDEDAFKYIRDTALRIRKGEAALQELDGICQVSELKCAEIQRRRVAGE